MNQNPIRVYIATPVYGSGTLPTNLRRALAVADVLLLAGFVPIVPNLFLLWEMVSSAFSEELVQTMNDSHLRTANVVVRLSGVSPGADREVIMARELGIPVVLWDSGDDEHLVSLVREVTPAVVSIDDLQDAVSSWLSRQPFAKDGQPVTAPALGVVEEVGELRMALVDAMETRAGAIARAVLKSSQGIRGTAEEHQMKMADAIGDIMVYAAGFAREGRYSMRSMVGVALAEITRRDWARFPVNGVSQ